MPPRTTTSSTTPRPLLVLGGGYTGRALFRLSSELGRAIMLSSRTPDRSLAEVPEPARVRFDLLDATTWETVPAEAEIIWTFPAAPVSQVQAFVEQAGPRIRRCVVLGSSSAYDQAPEVARGEWITEEAAVDQTIPRVQGEEWLRSRLHATVLRVAGTYGPGRNPLNWIRQGRVPYSHRCVNLIHVDDLAGICLAALERGRPGEVYNVSDGTPRRWSDIMDEAAARWQVPRPESTSAPKLGKKLSIDKLTRALGYEIRHPDLFTALERLERASSARPPHHGT